MVLVNRDDDDDGDGHVKLCTGHHHHHHHYHHHHHHGHVKLCTGMATGWESASPQGSQRTCSAYFNIIIIIVVIIIINIIIINTIMNIFGNSLDIFCCWNLKRSQLYEPKWRLISIGMWGLGSIIVILFGGLSKKYGVDRIVQELSLIHIWRCRRRG